MSIDITCSITFHLSYWKSCHNMFLSIRRLPNFRCLLLKSLPHSSAFSWGDTARAEQNTQPIRGHRWWQLLLTCPSSSSDFLTHWAIRCHKDHKAIRSTPDESAQLWICLLMGVPNNLNRHLDMGPPRLPSPSRPLSAVPAARFTKPNQITMGNLTVCHGKWPFLGTSSSNASCYVSFIFYGKVFIYKRIAIGSGVETARRPGLTLLLHSLSQHSSLDLSISPPRWSNPSG